MASMLDRALGNSFSCSEVSGIIDIQNIADRFASLEPGENVEIPDVPWRLPFNTTWFKCRIGNIAPEKDGKPQFIDCGMLVTEIKGRSPGKLTNLVVGVYLDWNGYVLALTPGTVLLNDDGYVMTLSSEFLGQKGYRVAKHSNDTIYQINSHNLPWMPLGDENYISVWAMHYAASGKELSEQEGMELTSEMIAPCITLLGQVFAFLHCKNVNLSVMEEFSPGLIKKRQAKKNKAFVSKIYTLEIKGPSSKKGKSDNKTGEKKSFHICRGHFKTFTAEAPLLGKAIGTYWWPSYARGSKKEGIIHKDYKLA